jgi:hypothetical protein
MAKHLFHFLGRHWFHFDYCHCPNYFLGELGISFFIHELSILLDHYPFLLEALIHIDSSSFPFQQQLKGACDLVPLMVCACLPCFEHFINKQNESFQNSILKHLHQHTFSNILSNGAFNVHQTCILSCLSPCSKA